MNLALKSCTVRPWQMDDAESLVRHANSRNVWLTLRDLFPHPYTPMDAEIYLNRVTKDPARAKQRVKFIEHYRSYVINYNLGEEMVRIYVEERGGTADQPEKRWREFERLLSSPRLPSGLN